VTITVTVGDNTLEVRVTDDGPGIPWETAELLFLPHVRGLTDSSGAGLGLAIARGIVEAHGGAIRFDASGRFEASSSGACVVVTLPIEPVVAER
jgi:two-component system sensor histidine kinase KdpD